MLAGIPDEMMKELLEKAVHQQLFVGEDEIMGRMPQNTMHFKDVGDLLSKFIEEIRNNMHLINPDNIDLFLKYFEELFNLNLEETRERLRINFEGMGELEGQEIAVVYMTLTKLLENVREQAYHIYGIDRITEEYEAKTKKKFDEDIKDKFHRMGAVGNRDISLLYNLSFIRLLAEKFGVKNIALNAKRQITMKINNIIDALS